MKSRAKRLTVPEAAAELGLTPSAIYARIKRGDVVAKQVGGRWILTRAAVKGMIQAQKDYDQWRKDEARRRSGRLTDEEFLQALWDNDPDD